MYRISPQVYEHGTLSVHTFTGSDKVTDIQVHHSTSLIPAVRVRKKIQVQAPAFQPLPGSDLNFVPESEFQRNNPEGKFGSQERCRCQLPVDANPELPPSLVVAGAGCPVVSLAQSLTGASAGQPFF